MEGRSAAEAPGGKHGDNFMGIHSGETCGKPWENHRKMMDLWCLMGYGWDKCRFYETWDIRIYHLGIKHG